jgi:hypothetical protein
MKTRKTASVAVSLLINLQFPQFTTTFFSQTRITLNNGGTTEPDVYTTILKTSHATASAMSP